MRRLLAAVIILGGVFGLAGCSTNPNEDVVHQVISQIKNAASTVELVESKLESAIKDAEKKKTKIKVGDLNSVFEEAKRLREAGKQLISLKDEVISLKDQLSAEEKERLAEKHAAEVRAAIDRLDKAQQELEQTLAKAAEVAEPEAQTKLREEINASQEEFVVITRRL